ncbi:MAG: DUF1684 domain-containing protein [Dehalococcoidia bacterium]|nr:DUF1684 domain-containing protein [Dehalococcoidia bacterium]
MDAETLTALREFRQEKDAFFRTDPMSPLLPPERQSFVGLAYYDPNDALIFEVEPELHEDPEDVVLQTSDATTRTYQRWANLPFEVDGEAVALTVYRDPESGELFLPFQDTTSGGETYGAGRYLELPVLEDGRVLLDFNYAYHPFCAYNPAYSCPIPPFENRLPVPIPAGERNSEA